METNEILGEVIISEKEWEKNYSMKLEYYLIKEKMKEKNYGIGIKKTCIDNKEVYVEQKELNGILNNESQTKELLNLLLANKVTPIGLKETVIEIFKCNEAILNYSNM